MEAQEGFFAGLTGTLCGCAAALLCISLLNYWVSRSAGAKASSAATSIPVLSRRERAEQLLEAMRQQHQHKQQSTQTTVPSAKPAEDEVAAAPSGSGDAAQNGPAFSSTNNANEGGSSEGSSSWASTAESDEEEEEDSEYERMEDLRLKMVFVVRHPVQPKMTAQEVAVLTASAGVQLIELHQPRLASDASNTSGAKKTKEAVSARSSSPMSVLGFTPSEDDQQRWLHWYLWWNRIGCAKITLKCPETATMQAVLEGAAEMRLPIVQLRRSHCAYAEGVAAQKGFSDNVDEVVVIAMGPAPSDVLEPVTGALKLFS